MFTQNAYNSYHSLNGILSVFYFVLIKKMTNAYIFEYKYSLSRIYMMRVRVSPPQVYQNRQVVFVQLSYFLCIPMKRLQRSIKSMHFV